MRLIDADAINPMRCPKSISEMREWINEQPTVCDIDAIRREIEDLYIITNPASTPYDGGYYTALIDARGIIDKYTKGEGDSNV